MCLDPAEVVHYADLCLQARQAKSLDELTF